MMESFTAEQMHTIRFGVFLTGKDSDEIIKRYKEFVKKQNKFIKQVMEKCRDASDYIKE